MSKLIARSVRFKYVRPLIIEYIFAQNEFATRTVCNVLCEVRLARPLSGWPLIVFRTDCSIENHFIHKYKEFMLWDCVCEIDICNRF